MKCPFCNYEEDKVVDSRATKEGKAIRRRRECLECGKRFTTYEYIEAVPLTVVKNSGRREPYDRAKLMTGLYTACKKRPIPPSKLQEIVDEIETKISKLTGDEVPSRIIGELVMRELKNVDEVAFMRFASVCRNFNAVSQFLDQINEMKDGERPARPTRAAVNP